tara:strand:+ start:344 stop:586 length:243 start_codon:yes stop_codon:yes gene_type:complete
MKLNIHITLKNGVLDPQGRAIKQSLNELGFREAEEVRQGKYLEIELNELDPNKAIIKAKEMCEKLLANTVIENYQVEIDE